MCFILSNLKCYGSLTSCSINHLWRAKERISEKIARWKISFSAYRTLFYFIFLFFWPFLLSDLITFLFILNDLKCYKSTTWSSTNHLWTLIAREKHTRNFFECFEINLCSVRWFVLLSSWPPLLWGLNFVISNLFSTNVSVSDAQREGIQVLFGHQKQHSLPLCT
jgi:hypothetical protein